MTDDAPLPERRCCFEDALGHEVVARLSGHPKVREVVDATCTGAAVEEARVALISIPVIRSTLAAELAEATANTMHIR